MLSQDMTYLYDLLGCHLLVGGSVDGARSSIGCEASEEKQQKPKESGVGREKPNLLQGALAGDKLLNH